MEGSWKSHWNSFLDFCMNHDYRRGALLFFELIHQISMLHGLKNGWFGSNLSKIIRLVAAIKSLRFALFPLIFTFYLNRYTLVIEFSPVVFWKKKDDSASPWDPSWPIYLQTKPSLKLLDCGRKNQIYIHIDTYFANQNSDHDDKSTL